MKSKPTIIICGDPKSTFIEILIKSLKNNSLKNGHFPIILICSKKLFMKELKRSKAKIHIHDFNSLKNLKNNSVYIIDVPLDLKKLSLSKINTYIKDSFETGLNMMNENNSFSLVNGPISKTNFLKGNYEGITEFLAYKTGTLNEVMLIFNKKLSVSPITTHIPLSKVEQKIKKKIIINKIHKINEFYKKIFGFKPNIAITGLNPHCETFIGKNIEKTEILPAIKVLKKERVKIFGPFSADTIFLKDNRKKYNVIVGMYHDQVLGPMKTIYGFNAINITIGLPFLRITPDHGPNYKMYKLNKSKPDSLIQAFKFIKKYAHKT